MGQVVDRTTFSRRDRQRYRIKVQRCLDTLGDLLSSYPFSDTEPMTGVEIEFNLVDPELAPSLNGSDVLDTINSGEWQTELGRWNLELNLPPRPLPGDQWNGLAERIRQGEVLGKPGVVNEIGQSAGSCGSTEQREADLRTKVNGQRAAGTAAALFWAFVPDPRTDQCTYDIGPQDPAFDLVADLTTVGN